MSGVDFDGLDGMGQVGLAGEVSDDFLIPQGLACLGGHCAGGGQERADLLNEAGLDHGLYAGVDAAVKVLAAAAKTNISTIISGVGAAELLLETTDRLGGEFKDLQGADDSAKIVRMDALG